MRTEKSRPSKEIFILALFQVALLKNHFFLTFLPPSMDPTMKTQAGTIEDVKCNKARSGKASKNFSLPNSTRLCKFFINLQYECLILVYSPKVR